MDLNQLKDLLELVREHELSEFEIEHEGLRLKVRKDGTGSVIPHPPAAAPSIAPSSSAGAVASPAPVASAAVSAPPATESTDTEIELAVVKSPIVGTFYRSPEPGSASFVEVGASVKKGQVLCIIEAMKLMNEIESDVDGTVVQVFPKNSQPVEFG